MKNRNNDFQGYEIWNMQMPEISPRSVFYNLPPVGIGTPDVESFSGYISRLAQEHYLSPVVLLKNSVGDLSELPKSLHQNSISAVFAKSLNGYGDNASQMVKVLCKATCRADLQDMTLLNWKDKVSNHKLLKNHLSWCPACYEEQKEAGKTVYEKLLWTIEKTSACHIHELPLVESCPHCCKKLKILSGRSRPGYCSKCLGWLGSNLISSDDFDRFRSDEERKLEVWKAVKIGEALLKSFSFFADAGRGKFMENLTGLIRSQGESINDFARRTGIWHISLRRLLKGEVLPTVEVLLSICLPLEISIADLFDSQNEIRANKSAPTVPPKNPKTKNEMTIHLNVFLSEHPPPSANEISRRTGWGVSRIQRNFPEKYKDLVERYIQHTKQKYPQLADEEIEKALTEAAGENPPPSLQSVFRRVGCRSTGFRYYERFPALCREITSRYKKENNKTFDAKAVEIVLRTALAESPPPSFSEIAKRVKCSRETLNKKLPSLSKVLHQRYKNYLEDRRMNNRLELYKAVEKAVLIIQKKQLSVSEGKVKKHLPRKWNDVTFKNIYRQVTKELGIETEK